MEIGILLEYGIFAFVIVALIANLYVIRQIGKGVLSVTFISFAAGTLLIGLSRLFLYLAETLQLYHLSAVDIHVWWHLIFYAGIFCFIWGGMRLKTIASSQTPAGFGAKDIVLISSLIVLSLIIFVVAAPLEPVLSSFLVGSFIDVYGIHHFVAFVLAFIAATYILYIKKNWGALMAPSITPILMFLFLMGLQHVWELLVESLKVIPIDDQAGETIEQFFVIPALISLSIGLFRVGQFINSQTKSNKTT